MALYGAPVWLDSFGRRENLSRLRTSQRIIATRVARGYRAISYEAACVLAGSMPWSRGRTPSCIDGGPMSAAGGRDPRQRR